MSTVDRPSRGAQQPRPSQAAELLDLQPPRSQEAEQSLLGSLLLLPEICDEVALIVRPEDFYDDAHQKIYKQFLAVHEQGRRVDHTLLIDQLRKAGEFEAIGGTPKIVELAKAVPTAAHGVHYAKIIRDKSILRSLILSSTEILRDAYDETVESRQTLARAEQRIFSILDNEGGGKVHSIAEVLEQSLLRIDARMKNDHAIGGLETAFKQFNDMTGGLHKSELIILAARPSMGKTALAMNLAEYAALTERATTLFVSLEMSAIELADRLLCSVAKVDSRRLRTGSISGEDRHRLIEASAAISQAPLHVDDSPSRTMTEIAAVARRLKRREGLGLVVIDYLQLIEPDNSKDPRQEQVSKIARRLKGLARELEVPILCLAQLNRQAEEKSDHRPKLSHLRESGAIEQDADVVMFIHRDDYYGDKSEAPPDEGTEAVIIIEKQRNGPTGEVKVNWVRRFTRFEDPEPQAYEQFEAFNSGF